MTYPANLGARAARPGVASGGFRPLAVLAIRGGLGANWKQTYQRGTRTDVAQPDNDWNYVASTLRYMGSMPAFRIAVAESSDTSVFRNVRLAAASFAAAWAAPDQMV